MVVFACAREAVCCLFVGVNGARQPPSVSLLFAVDTESASPAAECLFMPSFRRVGAHYGNHPVFFFFCVSTGVSGATLRAVLDPAFEVLPVELLCDTGVGVVPLSVSLSLSLCVSPTPPPDPLVFSL